MSRLLNIAIILLLVLATTAFNQNIVAPAPRPAREVKLSVGPSEGTFLILSDIHFDPFSGLDMEQFAQLTATPAQNWKSIFESERNGKISPDGKDSNYVLLKSALDAAKNSGQQYDYVLVLGDYLAHNFTEKYWLYRPGGKGYEQFVEKTLSFVSDMIQGEFPGIPVYGALGNNDSIAGDYAPPGEALLSVLSKDWKTVAADREATKDFRAGGYYAVPHPTVKSAEFIVLNTSFLSQHFDTPSIAKGDQGAAELNWLDAQLTELQSTHKTAILLMHIPPGVDAFASSKPEACTKPVLFWKHPYLDSFLTIANRHEAILRDSFAGHTHINDVRILADSSGKSFFQTQIVPSISRDHHNSPAFEIGAYDKTSGALLDYDVTTLKENRDSSGSAEPQWRLAYDFQQQSGAPYSPDALKTLSDIVRFDPAIRNRYLDFYAAQMAPGASAAAINWRVYSCAQTELAPEQFSACACPH